MGLITLLHMRRQPLNGAAKAITLHIGFSVAVIIPGLVRHRFKHQIHH
jgi:hypothetical protein